MSGLVDQHGQPTSPSVTQPLGPVSPPLGPRRAYYPKKGMAWNPLRTLEVNSVCFCGSGRKFKKCCRLTVAECVSEANAVKLREFMLARRKFPDLTIKFRTEPADSGDLPGTVQHVVEP